MSGPFVGADAEQVSRSLAAEVRAVEAGHRAVVQPDGWVRVVSDTIAGKWYRVEFAAGSGGLVLFTCRPEGNGAYRDDHRAASARAGLLPCMHAALAARRLEREGLAAYDDPTGLWHTTTPRPECAPTATEAEPGRWVVACPCGYRASLATTSAAYPKQLVARHLAATQPDTDTDPFAGFPKT